jgi:hypothetical protein
MKKAYAIIVLGILVLFSLRAQNKIIDSLKKVLEPNVPDSTRIKGLCPISFFFLEVNFDSAKI